MAATEGSSRPQVSDLVAEKATGALLQYIEKKKEDTSKQLFDVNSESMLLKFGLHDIPQKSVHKPMRIELPHSMWSGQDVCVFVREDMSDRTKKFHEKKTKAWKNLVKSAAIPEVKKVIDVQKLKREYKQYEQKRELSKSYDLFLCDKSIIEMMPRELGKSFENSRKKPIPVAIEKKNPAEDIQAAIKSTFFCLPKGPDASVRIGRCNMEGSQLSENLLKVARSTIAHLRTQKIRIKSIHLTATDCISLPLWEEELSAEGVETRKTILTKKASESSEEEDEVAEEKKEAVASADKVAMKNKRKGESSAEKKEKVMPLLKKAKTTKKKQSE